MTSFKIQYISRGIKKKVFFNFEVKFMFRDKNCAELMLVLIDAQYVKISQKFAISR